LKSDIQKQLYSEKQVETERDYENELLEKIANESTVAIPNSLIDEEVKRIEQEVRQNLAYRGQTWSEYLKEEGKSETEYLKSLRDPSEKRVKIGLVLTEVAEQEKINVSPQELDMRLQLLKGQYKDPAMQTELDKPEAKRSIYSRMLSEKTIARLCDYATGKVA
jgi:trigger factor